MNTITKKGRIAEIDALRGIALFGILLVNIFVFHAPYSYYGEFYGSLEGKEAEIFETMIAFAGGKFLFIFSFLFGYGIQMQYNSLKEGFQNYFIRRMLILLLIGLLHILLFWFGDILASYAILGLMIIPTFKFSNKTILLLALLFLLIRPIYYLGAALFSWPLELMSKAAEMEELITTFQEGTYWEILLLRMKETIAFQPENLVWYIPKSFGLFFVGLYASRVNIVQKIKDKKGRYLIITVLLLIISALWEINKLNFFQLFDMEATPIFRPFLILINITFEFLMGIAYIFGFLLLFQTSKLLCSLFAKAGRMALTNYIGQSLFCIFLFYGFGLAYYAKLKPSDLVFITIVIFAFNLLFSHFYLKYRDMGPLEYYWRRLAKGNTKY